MSKKRTIEDLREALFDTIEKVKSGEIEIDKAETVKGLADTIVNSAKVEVEFMKHTESHKSLFLPTDDEKRRIEAEAQKQLKEG